MISGFIRLFTGPLVDGVVDVIKGYQQKEMTEAEMRAEVEKSVLGTLTSVVATQGDIIKTEAQSDDWLTRRWRPIVALSSFFSYWYVIVLYPHLYAAGLMPQLGFGEQGLENLYYLTTICVTGYVGGRTIEKVTNTIVNRVR